MLETKKQQKEAVKNTKSFKNNSLNEFNINTLTFEHKRQLLKILIKELLSSGVSDTILNPYYFDCQREVVSKHLNNWYSKELYELLSLLRKGKISINDFGMTISKNDTTVESVNFFTQSFSELVHSIYNDDIDSKKFEN